MAKHASFDKGPSIDGKGMKIPKEKSPQESVQGDVASSAPGGESNKGSHIEMIGPNGAKK